MKTHHELRPWLVLFAASVAVAVLMLAGASVALASVERLNEAEKERNFRLCERATARWERISAVPNNLLHAISMAESGRWSRRDGRVRAWPWTVTSGGPGSYFATKAEALAEVERLKARGVRNIDVGCMQVNMQFHGHEFRSVEDAMDPDINAAYAAKFLTRLKAETGNWTMAAGYYHSRTPERTRHYQGKVKKFWASLNAGAPEQPRPAMESPTPPPSYVIAPIDRKRTAALNERFRKLTTAARKLRTDLDPELRRKRQLEAWRSARGRAEQLQHLLAVRQAELALRRERELQEAQSSRAERFAENRRRQLADWRTRTVSGN